MWTLKYIKTQRNIFENVTFLFTLSGGGGSMFIYPHPFQRKILLGIHCETFFKNKLILRKYFFIQY